jgi:hypothetical protein
VTGRALVLAGLALALLGCGYRAGFTIPEQKTVGVAIFGNTSKERDVERDLHGALSEAVQRLVASPLVTPSTADYLIDGYVVEYARRSGIRSKDNVRLETGVRISVVAELVRQTGRADGREPAPEDVVRRVTVFDERGYLLADPLGESRARELVLRNLAERIVVELFADLAFADVAPPPPR